MRKEADYRGYGQDPRNYDGTEKNEMKLKRKLLAGLLTLCMAVEWLCRHLRRTAPRPGT